MNVSHKMLTCYSVFEDIATLHYLIFDAMILKIRSLFWMSFLSLSFLSIYPLYVVSQQSIDVSYNYGRVVVHSPEIETLSNNPVNGFSLNYNFKNKSGKDWRRYYNYPNYGLNYIYKSYNNPNVLGDSHSITSFLQLSFLRKHKHFDVGFKGLAGFGFFTKIYDPVANPSNQAISAHFNVTAEARLYSRVRIKPLYFEYSYGLNHSSNGLIKSPNLGINTINNSFSVGYEFENQITKSEIQLVEKIPFIKHEFWVYAAAGIKIVEMDSERYLFSNFSINYSKQLTVINKMGLGMDFSRDPSLTLFAEQIYYYTGDKDLSFRYAINIHNEFILGNTGLYAAYGIYLGDQEFYPRQRYYKAGFKFYFNNVVGVAIIRAIPLFRAEVIEFGIGYRITDKKYRNSK